MPDRPLRRRPGGSVLRGLTDRTVLDEVLSRAQITRAEVAAATGLSKPTVSASFARLEAAGILVAAGARTGLRGRVATDYVLAPTAGWVLALDVDQQGVRTSSVDLAGAVIDEHQRPPVEHGDTAAMVRVLRASVRRSVRVAKATHGPVRAVTIAVANAVDPATRRVLSLPDAPFAEGVVQPARVFADLVPAPVLVDNHVTCAVIAEHAGGAGVGVDDVVYVFAGAGIGAGLIVGGRVVRGAHGLAGEVGYLAAGTGASTTTTLVGALAEQGFALAGTTALDVDAVRGALAHGGDAAEVAVRVIGAAIGQVVVGIGAVVDPSLVLLGGPIGRLPAMLAEARRTVAALAPRPMRLEPGALGERAPLQGALQLALQQARSHLLDPA